MTCFLGLDPGLHGGAALLRPPGSSGANPVAIMPVAGGVIDIQSLAAWVHVQLSSPRDNMHVVIEQVGAMPKQGLSSTFKFGTGYGQIIGMCQALWWPYTLVRPQAWKANVLAGTPKDKDAAIAFCQREYPSISLIPERCRVPHDGIADALCLATYGLRTRS